VERVGAVVDGELVFGAVKGEAALGYAVAEAAYQRAEVGGVGDVGVEGVEAERDVGVTAGSVGEFE
jgi:hypothetical protein